MSARVLGHERPMHALGERLRAGRLAHAYLFTGIAGVGKKRVALELAREYLCEESRGCGACVSCRLADAWRHPDLLLFQDLQALRWEDRDRLERIVAGTGDLGEAIEELREGLLLEPTSSAEGGRLRLGFALDPEQIFRVNSLDPSPFADRIARAEERGTMSPAARRLAAALYFDETSRYPYRGKLGIHLVTRREPLTPDRGSLRDFLARTSLHGHGKVVVVDDAHNMGEEAQNALLKTLEEPPRGTLLILVTDQPDELLPTIRSRAQEIRFGRLAPEILTEALRGQGTAPEAAAFIAAWADGSLGRALEADLDDLAGRRDRAMLLHAALADGNVQLALHTAALFATADEENPDRVRRMRRMSRDLELVLLWYRDLAVAAAHGPGARLLNADLAAVVARESARRPASAWRRHFEIVAGTLSRLTPSSDYRLQAEEMVASLLLSEAAA